MSPATLRETLRRAIGVGFDRRALRERLAQLQGPHEAAARDRRVEIDVAKAELTAWREPLLRLQRLEAADRAAAAAEARERDAIEAQLRAHPASCVVALSNFRDSIYARVNAQRAGEDVVPPERMAALGAALCAATAFVRDDAWRLTDADAQTKCLELRGAIDAALEGKPAAEDAA